MSIHKLFAVNLRDECLRFSSIAEVCRGADINRQQFNKYLSGQALPNPRTLQRLCKFLGVEEHVLFERRSETVRLGGLEFSRPGHGGSEKPTAPREKGNPAWLLEQLELLPHFQRSTLAPGYYYCYMPLNEYEGFLIRTIIKITPRRKFTFFARRTSFRLVTSPKTTLSFGRHVGIVLADSTSNYLVGYNKVYPNELTVLKIAKPGGNTSRPAPGHGFIHGVATSMVANIWLEWLGDGASIGKKALAQMGVVPCGHESVSAAIQIAYRESRNGPAPQADSVAEAAPILLRDSTGALRAK